MLLELIALVVTLTLLLYVLTYKRFSSKTQYWAQKGVAQYEDINFPMATLSETFLNIMVEKINMHDLVLKNYRKFKGKKFFGTYWPISATPILTIRDLNLVQHVLIADFDHFADRNFGGQLVDKGTSKNDIIWKNILFTIKGGKNHKLVRQTLSPAFTSSKLKQMLELMSPISDQLENVLADAADRETPADFGNLAEKMSVETISGKWTMTTVRRRPRILFHFRMRLRRESGLV